MILLISPIRLLELVGLDGSGLSCTRSHDVFSRSLAAVSGGVGSTSSLGGCSAGGCSGSGVDKSSAASASGATVGSGLGTGVGVAVGAGVGVGVGVAVGVAAGVETAWGSSSWANHGIAVTTSACAGLA